MADMDIEIARALVRCAHCDPDAIGDNGFPLWQEELWRAETALAVMRSRMIEPTEEMVRAGRKAMDEDWNVDAEMFVQPEVACFRAMASVMLGEKG